MPVLSRSASLASVNNRASVVVLLVEPARLSSGVEPRDPFRRRSPPLAGADGGPYRDSHLRAAAVARQGDAWDVQTGDASAAALTIADLLPPSPFPRHTDEESNGEPGSGKGHRVAERYCNLYLRLHGQCPNFPQP
ncbi:hypothetical protein N658DRAFT_484496 [Parathielavia hyrcaniae]|uniref:Uncharacterized protein n=1 Tax=Parathielavia hyrcaniae TaxID=113614 RepID=A0AAN6T3M2_9PEZI|nr:hypothetical protein N658DRAFT_484496 [Parathielavia hyrcaniae]